MSGADSNEIGPTLNGQTNTDNHAFDEFPDVAPQIDVEDVTGEDEFNAQISGRIHDDLPEPSVLSSPRSELSDGGYHEDGRTEEFRTRFDKLLPLQQSEREQTGDRDTTESMQHLDWEELQDRFAQRMDEKWQEEQDILEEFNSLTQYYNVWAQTPALREQERASKRLRTRIAYVQNKETELGNKRSHYSNVIQAFETALQLLRQA